VFNAERTFDEENVLFVGTGEWEATHRAPPPTPGQDFLKKK
jgi:hypothetical protein